MENSNLNYIIEQEAQANDQKEKLEKQALIVVSDDLESQLSALHDNAEKLTGRITPFVMEQILHEKL